MPLQRYVSRELTHFVGRSLQEDDERYALLTQVILREGQLGRSDPEHPSGSGFTLRILGDADPLSNSMYDLPMVCFCDIPQDDFEIHMAKYSQFGIAFQKSFLVGKGARPVFYIPRPLPDRGSAYLSDFQYLSNLNNVFAELVQAAGPNPDKPSPCTEGIRALVSKLSFPMSRLNLDVLSFIKFFDCQASDADPSNYYMEREWRVQGTMSFSLKDVSRIVLPTSFAVRLRQDVPNYVGQLMFAD